jgi:uncharacterized protein YecT (DUF1311 family)
MRRQLQNISFVTIIGMLLSCAFFFSQQTKANLRETAPEITATPLPEPKTLADIPECPEDMSLEERTICLETAVEISQTLLDAAVDRLLAGESRPEKRIALMELVFAWEESRDADCEFARDLAEDEDPAVKEVVYLDCFKDHNLNRLDQLEGLGCAWYPAPSCSEKETGTEQD